MKKFVWLSLLAGMLLITGLVWAQPTKVYNIAAILDRPDANLPEAPSIGFCNELMRQGVEFHEQQNRAQRARALINFIKRYIAPEQWQDKSQCIYSSGDWLYVSHNHKVVAQITALLSTLTTAKQIAITLDFQIYEIAAQAFGAYWPKSLTTPELPALSSKNPQIKLLAQEKINTFPGQYVQLARLRQIRYLRDQSIEIAEGSAIYDPIIGKINEGNLFTFRAFLAADGKSIYLQGTASSAQCQPSIRNYFGENKKTSFLQLPAVAIDAVQGTTALALGRPTIIGLYSGKNSVRLLVATARIATSKKTTALPQLWPVHYLVELAPNYSLSKILPPMDVAWKVPIVAPKAKFKEMPTAPFALPDSLVSHLHRLLPGKRLPQLARYEDWLLSFGASSTLAPEINRLMRHYAEPMVIRLGYYQVKDSSKQEVLAKFSATTVVEQQQYEWLLPHVEKQLYLQVGAMPGQKVSACSVLSHSFVRDFNVEVAAKSSAYDPVIGFISEGIRMEVQAGASENGRLHLRLQAKFSQLPDGFHRIPIDKGELYLECPRLDSRIFDGQIGVVPGTTSLVAISERANDKLALFLVRVERMTME